MDYKLINKFYFAKFIITVQCINKTMLRPVPKCI